MGGIKNRGQRKKIPRLNKNRAGTIKISDLNKTKIVYLVVSIPPSLP